MKEARKGTPFVKNLKIVSYNAGTLCDTIGVERKPDFINQAPLIAQQLKDFHIVGIQEARAPTSKRMMGHWLRISGGKGRNKKGSSVLGIELWINTGLNLLDIDDEDPKPQKAFIKEGDVTIVLGNNPRILVASIRCTCLDAYVVVAHAPHSGDSDVERDTFWDSLDKAIGGRANVVLLIDSNAKVGYLPSVAIGDWCADDENLNGRCLHRMLLDKGLCSPSTFAHSGSSFTWTAPNSSTHRGDFVAIPCAWFPSVVRSFKPDDFYNLLGADDHSPVALHLRDCFGGCRQEGRCAWPRPSPTSLADPDKVRYFSLLLQQFDTPSFCTPVDTHYKQTVEYYHWAASMAFPGKRSGCRTLYYSDVTWSIVVLRKKVTANHWTSR